MCGSCHRDACRMARMRAKARKKTGSKVEFKRKFRNEIYGASVQRRSRRTRCVVSDVHSPRLSNYNDSEVSTVSELARPSARNGLSCRSRPSQDSNVHIVLTHQPSALLCLLLLSCALPSPISPPTVSHPFRGPPVVRARHARLFEHFGKGTWPTSFGPFASPPYQRVIL